MFRSCGLSILRSGSKHRMNALQQACLCTFDIGERLEVGEREHVLVPLCETKLAVNGRLACRPILHRGGCTEFDTTWYVAGQHAASPEVYAA